MADSPVLYVYYRPDNDDAYPGVPGRHITEADWAAFSPSQRRTVEEATTQEGYTRRKVWVHRDLVDETEQERAAREAAEQAARDAYERGRSLVRYREFEKVVPGPGEVIVGTADGPVARDVSEIGGGIKPEDGVFGVGVRRIIASTDPNYPLEDGDLLVLIETETYFTDFSTATVGALPDDWSEPFTAANATVVDDGGNRILRYTSPANARRFLAWNAVPVAGSAEASCEIVWKWRVDNGNAGVAAWLNVTGGIGTEDGYNGGHLQTNNFTIRIHRHQNGTAQQLASGTKTIPVNTWTISRFQKDATMLRYKEWAHGTAEPDDWNLEAAYTGKGDGMTGLMSLGIGQVDYDWVGVAVGGGTPPMGS